MSFIRKSVFLAAVATSLATLITGCNTSTGSYTSFGVYSKPLYGKIAEETIKYEGIARNPVIIVHGFLGSNLVDPTDHKNVWGTFRVVDDVINMQPQRVRDLAVPMVYGKPLKDLKGGAIVSGMLEDAKVRVGGVYFTIAGYNGLINILTDAGFCLEGKPLPKGKSYENLFLFAYDWRRDLPENAARLHEFVLKKKAYLQKQYERIYGLKNYDVQFDIIAHSMGGLVSRYYLRYGNADMPADGSLAKPTWAGSNHIDKLLIVGTPNGGYLDTILEMVNGLKLEAGAPMIPQAILGTWATYYQMMPPPSTRSLVYAGDKSMDCIDFYDPNVWIKNKWGLANPDQDKYLKILLPHAKTKAERRKIAIDHLTKCLNRAKQFINTMRIHANPPDDVRLYLFQGDAVLTTRRAEVDPTTGALKVTNYEPGDGKVLVTSTYWDERLGMKKWVPYPICPIQWTAVYRLTAAHMGITRMEVFADNMTWCLLVTQTPAQVRRRDLYKKYYELP